MNGYWVYKGVVKVNINGRTEVVGKVGEKGLDYWRLFAHGRA